MSTSPRIAIVGGGFSGTMALVNLARLAETPFIVDWFESEGEPGTGVAYRTDDPAHLLNVRVAGMGALPGKPGDFWDWLQTEPGRKAAERLWPGQPVSKDGYAPRALYGAYLGVLAAEAVSLARAKGITVNILKERIVDAAPFDKNAQRIVLTTEDDRETVADALILATGNLPPRDSVFQSSLIRGKTEYVANIWNAAPDSLYPDRIKDLSADSEIVIIGTGLTMVDAVLTLRTRGYKGTVTAISRHGLMPQAHQPGTPYPAWAWVARPDAAPRTAFGLLTGLRAEIGKAQEYDWRAVVDSLRPVTQILWKRLSITEKRRFLRLLATFWNVHRHRMAPDIAQTLKSMRQSGALKIVAGKIYYVGSDEDGLTVAYRKRGANRMETIRAPVVLNCTGPEYDIAMSSHKLLNNMCDRGLLTVGPLRIGIELTRHGTAEGTAPDAIFPIGPMLIGELWECTAVPELREQAKAVAEKVLERLAGLAPARGGLATLQTKAALAMRKLKLVANWK